MLASKRPPPCMSVPLPPDTCSIPQPVPNPGHGLPLIAPARVLQHPLPPRPICPAPSTTAERSTSPATKAPPNDFDAALRVFELLETTDQMRTGSLNVPSLPESREVTPQRLAGDDRPIPPGPHFVPNHDPLTERESQREVSQLCKTQVNKSLPGVSSALDVDNCSLPGLPDRIRSGAVKLTNGECLPGGRVGSPVPSTRAVECPTTAPHVETGQNHGAGEPPADYLEPGNSVRRQVAVEVVIPPYNGILGTALHQNASSDLEVSSMTEHELHDPELAPSEEGSDNNYRPTGRTDDPPTRPLKRRKLAKQLSPPHLPPPPALAVDGESSVYRPHSGSTRHNGLDARPPQACSGMLGRGGRQQDGGRASRRRSSHKIQTSPSLHSESRSISRASSEGSDVSPPPALVLSSKQAMELSAAVATKLFQLLTNPTPSAMVSSPVHPASQEDGRNPRYGERAGSGPRRTKWTQGEEDILRTMKRKRCSWLEIEERLPWRTPASLRQRYSVLKNS
ncbi:hypothetical protein I7I50_01450 [Histoplasma capsulatum G186AR]|uniref:Myb-like domain-containing protein n=1 Tax=Ajellomyces capsulatus TaxID=5037 RepID=A0A8H7YCW1_AJECA|nr:hypothetical protein I7I52_12566 [Histoplasma capsulatum]QSS73326.1 hypothetical protein I7I50_01450 [Histoplasma capsulatum G186AR]